MQRQKLSYDKKGQMALADVPNAVRILIVIAIFLAIAALIVVDVQDEVLSQQSNSADKNTTAVNITKDALTGLGTLGSFQSLIALVIAAAVILGLVALIGFRG